MIVLEPPLTSSGPWPPGVTPLAPLREAPRFMRGRGNGRWHIPRSGIPHAAGHVSYAFWCGQHASEGGHRREPLARRDEWPDDGLPVCGTCAGRFAGSRRNQPDLLFAPRRLDPPRLCPGSKIPGLYVPVPGNIGGTPARPTVVCLACDAITKEAGGYRGAYNWTPLHAAPHEPEDLVPGCPFHAWRALVPDGNGASTCSCGSTWP